jgi:hypothetical protein
VIRKNSSPPQIIKKRKLSMNICLGKYFIIMDRMRRVFFFWRRSSSATRGHKNVQVNIYNCYKYYDPRQIRKRGNGGNHKLL